MLAKCASKFLPIRVAILNLIGAIASNQEILNAFFLATEAFSPLSTKSIPKNHPHFLQKAGSTGSFCVSSILFVLNSADDN